MKTWTKITATVMLCVICTGCASVKEAKFALVDLDLRNVDQIKAGECTEASVAEARALPAEWWSMFVDLLKMINGRLRLLSVEWEAQPAE